ncbi:MAG: acyl-CoA reductase [Gemmatimonadaceae bacterium]|nr:acyl-CoA reductase [Chitinophagaceae bacterium]
MNLQQRLDLLEQLRKYLTSDEPSWLTAKEKAERENGWFVQMFISTAITNITNEFLDPAKLKAFAGKYKIPHQNLRPKVVGLVMAGNIPLVGFHDWLCIFLSGHIARVKPSSKDNVLIKHIVGKLSEWNTGASEHTRFEEMLKGCDAYIATGSNNSSRYFEYYFAKYPSIIRKNRTSVAILSGSETAEELDRLADDVHLYFGLGCRNVTKIFVPEQYDFVPILGAFKKYGWFRDHNKYHNNYDYQLALLLLNNKYYMTNESTLIVKGDPIFSPISQLHYEEYQSLPVLQEELNRKSDIQCIVGLNNIPFGLAQSPSLADFADGVDTMRFLQN